METAFSKNMSRLRRERGLSQRAAAADLHISQALLSHYENGAREPGLSFVCRACDYYGVTADFLLGREEDAHIGTRQAAEALSGVLDALKNSVQEAETIVRELGGHS